MTSNDKGIIIEHIADTPDQQRFSLDASHAHGRGEDVVRRKEGIVGGSTASVLGTCHRQKLKNGFVSLIRLSISVYLKEESAWEQPVEINGMSIARCEGHI